jgi:hypothetical protein
MEEDYQEEQGTQEQTQSAAVEPQSSDTVTMSREELQQLMAPMQEYSQEKAVTAATTDIQSRIADFDLGKVHDALKEMHKTNPSQAEAMNNPQGWELLWMRELASKTVSADAVNAGRNVDSDGGRQAVIDKIARGEGGVSDRVSLMEKYV